MMRRGKKVHIIYFLYYIFLCSVLYIYKSSTAQEHCGKKFALNQDRVRHEKSHTKQFSFACAVCNEVFSSASELRAHNKQAHQPTTSEPPAKKQKTSGEESYIVHDNNFLN